MYDRRGMLRTIFMCAVLAGCTNENPVESGAPQDAAFGSIEVIITVVGSVPDPDGYTVSVPTGEEVPLQTVGSLGGTVQFADMPPGSHTVRLDQLAANCTVPGMNPRPVTVRAGQTLQARFAVSCLGPGAVLVRTVTTGPELDPDGYTIILGSRQEQIGANDSLLIDELTIAANHSVALQGVATNCVSSSVPLSLEENVTTRVELVVRCFVRIPAGVYERISPFSDWWISYNGTLSERYVIHQDGVLELQWIGGNWGPYQATGTYSQAGATFSFVFGNG